ADKCNPKLRFACEKSEEWLLDCGISGWIVGATLVVGPTRVAPTISPTFADFTTFAIVFKSP
ncbi:MAG TPA: hypothetical protein PLI34_08955, partial [Saprospiraceae bacterium]|nr:hypothetical protein [Saprospiraceae bacterium]